MRFFRLALPLAAFVFLVGCEPTSSGQCGPTNCTGCCDSSGTCQPGGFPQQCGAQGFACRACAGGQLCQLGQCSGGSSTGGGSGGGGGTCTPKSCMELNKNCGEVSDGCGGTLMCGQCEVQGESCGAGGVANVCAQGTCTATTCVAEGKTCGSISDGCAAQLNCGTCSGANQVCNSMNTCEVVQCTARTCQQLGKNCGMVSDGCTGQLNCGTCTVSGQSCGGGGTANVCGAGACTPKTCQQLNATCGMVNDTCGNMIPCGTCSAPQTCGGAGVPNSCGAMCVGTCPTGFTCMTGDGACSGGNLLNVALDIPVPPQHTVSGVVTRNGIAPPMGCYSGYDVVDIEFEHATDARFNQRVSIRCNNSATDWSWTASLYPGTYKVTVSPDSGVPAASLPSWSTVVRTAFAVSGPQTNVALDIPVPPQHTVSGVVTRNGVAPSTACYSGYDVVDIEFEHSTDERFNQRVSIRCNNSVTDWRWTASLYPGTYKVTVSPDSGVPAASLPSWSTVVRTAFAVSGPQTNVALDIPVPPQHTVSGVVTRNGIAPPTGCYSGYDVVDIEFEHSTDARFHQRVSIRCNNSATDWSWTASLYPGTYKVTVSPDSGVPSASLPSWSTVVRTAFAVSGPQTNVALDIPVPPQHIVSGVVTRNGVAPSTACYSGYDVVDIEFEHATDTRFNQRVSIRCNNSATDWSWTASLYPGTYKVTVSPDSGVPAASLPSWSTVVRTAFAVSGPQTNVTLDIPVPPQHIVSGVVTRNGVAPSTACYSGYDVVDIEFEHATDARFHQRVSIRCNNSATDWSWTASLYPGTYKVTVSPDSGVPAASLPSWSTVVRTAFTVSGPQTNVALDIPVPPQHIVSGVVTRNGVALPTACYSGYDVVDIEFEHATDTRFNERVSIRCNNSTTDWRWAASLYPGIYKVTVSPDSGAPSGSLPSWSTVVINALRVP